MANRERIFIFILVQYVRIFLRFFSSFSLLFSFTILTCLGQCWKIVQTNFSFFLLYSVRIIFFLFEKMFKMLLFNVGCRLLHGKVWGIKAYHTYVKWLSINIYTSLYVLFNVIWCTKFKSSIFHSRQHSKRFGIHHPPFRFDPLAYKYHTHSHIIIQ